VPACSIRERSNAASIYCAQSGVLRCHLCLAKLLATLILGGLIIYAAERDPGGGLVVLPGGFLPAHRARIISAAARNNIPAIYVRSEFARDGGLLSYGPDEVDTWRRAASYVDRILRGAKPGDLPVQFPTKFEMAVNLKTPRHSA
jgi:hypothetical protein